MVQPRIDLLQHSEQLKIKIENDKRYIFDPIRKTFLVLQPEEFVRQLIIHHLIHKLDYSKNRISVEKKIIVNDTERRFDILIYNQALQPFLLIECKSPQVPINQTTLDQVAQYNIALRVPYLWVSNGRDHLLCRVDFEQKDYSFIERLPRFQ